MWFRQRHYLVQFPMTEVKEVRDLFTPPSTPHPLVSTRLGVPHPLESSGRAP